MHNPTDSGKREVRNPMLIMIDSGLQGIHDTTNALARAWRVLIYQNQLKGHQWHHLLTIWQQKQTFGRTSEKEQTSLKGNATRRLAKRRISWSALMTGFSILGFDRMVMKIELYKGDKVTELEIIVNDLDGEADKDEKD